MVNESEIISHVDLIVTKLRSRLAENIAYVGLVQVSNQAVLFVLSIGIKKLVGVGALGTYSTALTFASIALTITDLGLSIVVTREIARDKSVAHYVLGNSLAITLLSSTLACLVLLFIAPLMPYGRQTVRAIHFLSAVVALRISGRLLTAVFRGFQENRYEVYAVFAKNAVLLVMGMSALGFTRALVPLLGVMIVAEAAQIIYAWEAIHRGFFSFQLRFDRSWWKWVALDSWSLYLALVLRLITARADVLLLSLIKQEQAVGYYTMAYSFYIAVTALHMPLGAVALPRLSQHHTESKAKVGKSYAQFLLLSSTIGCVAGLALGGGADLAISFAYGATPKNDLVVQSLRILSVSVVFNFVTSITGTALNAVSLHKYTMITTAITAIMNVSLNLFLIPRWSFVGSSVATLLSDFAMFLIAVSFLYLKYFKKRNPLKLFHAD
jgi:O-antigen/teichoic acid export membrane protein